MPEGKTHWRWGHVLCWSCIGANGALALWLLGGVAVGFLSPSHLRYWPLAVGVPLALAWLFAVPVLGLLGQGLLLGSPDRRPRILGGIGLAVSAVLWILMVTAPSPGI